MQRCTRNPISDSECMKGKSYSHATAVSAKRTRALLMQGCRPWGVIWFPVGGASSSWVVIWPLTHSFFSCCMQTVEKGMCIDLIASQRQPLIVTVP